jgi:general secretion pathway protein K
MCSVECADRIAAMKRARCREQGFALLIVLWSLGLLSVIIIGLAAIGRREVKLAENLRYAAMAEAAADGATHQAIVRLMSGEWLPGPVPHVVYVGGTVVTVLIEDTMHLVNPNNAPVPLLAALLREVGADPQSAQAIAAAITAYRDQSGWDPTPDYVAAGLPYGPARRDFRTVAELRLVVGMTPELYERLAPHLSVWKLPMVVPNPADPVVAAAYVDAGPNGGFGPRFPAARWLRGQAFRLDARIAATALIGGAQFTRLAEVQLRGGPASAPPLSPYQIVAWGQPDD